MPANTRLPDPDGVAKPAHVLTPASTVRRVVNVTAIACVEAQIRAQQTGG